jgi:hypothetical protein
MFIVVQYFSKFGLNIGTNIPNIEFYIINII